MPSQRLLVVANRTCPCQLLIDEIARRADPAPEGTVRIVAPALNSRLRHFVSDVDDAVGQAGERLAEAVAALAEAGIRAEGVVGDADPLTAIEDELVRFEAQELVISTHPAGASNWLERGLIERARERFEVPVVHVVSEYGLVR